MRVADAISRLPKWMAIPGILTAVALATQIPAGAGEPSTSVQTEYLMTLHAPLAPPLAVDPSLLVVGIPATGGWVEGPRIKGKLVGPATSTPATQLLLNSLLDLGASLYFFWAQSRPFAHRAFGLPERFEKRSLILARLANASAPDNARRLSCQR
jgi:hypothetical protein